MADSCDMNTASTTSTAIHRAERLLCGCSIDPISGARFIACSQHAQVPVQIEPDAKLEIIRPCYECGAPSCCRLIHDYCAICYHALDLDHYED